MRYVLVHSPLVGPTTWSRVAEQLLASGRSVLVPSLLEVAKSSRPLWRRAVQLVTSAVGPSEDSIVLVGHSGAGAFLPAVAGSVASRVACYVFVDAQLPPHSGELAVDPDFLEQLRSLARDGHLPRWSEWWGPGVMCALVPDEKLRAAIEAELPELPLAYFEDAIPVPADWDRAPVAYLRFSDAYAAAAQDAADRGFLVDEMPGGHLHAVVEPVKVKDRIVELVAQLT